MPVDSVEGSGEELSRLSTQMVREEENQEPGPELDPEGLKKAREKAAEGKHEVSAGGGGGPGPAT